MINGISSFGTFVLLREKARRGRYCCYGRKNSSKGDDKPRGLRPLGRKWLNTTIINTPTQATSLLVLLCLIRNLAPKYVTKRAERQLKSIGNYRILRFVIVLCSKALNLLIQVWRNN